MHVVSRFVGIPRRRVKLLVDNTHPWPWLENPDGATCRVSSYSLETRDSLAMCASSLKPPEAHAREMPTHVKGGKTAAGLAAVVILASALSPRPAPFQPLSLHPEILPILIPAITPASCRQMLGTSAAEAPHELLPIGVLGGIRSVHSADQAPSQAQNFIQLRAPNPRPVKNHN
ncbi:hypothetical protein CKAH01_02864 [Colletotrichum kahawae]|uniref:Uncharacterized protein n=1 Tax=Colletotrichum kahawae TaxID=34407 RepID=A0AAD9XVG0_COLKA|nr:hypothetical protein CKAH01_02864 [Colletotrichum kahawae]